MELITKSPEETKALGREIANKITSNFQPPASGAVVVALSGDLGSGKTTFTQGFAEGLEIEKRILSPTFIIMRVYELETKRFYHVDLYRLEDKIDKEMENLGLFDIFKGSENIVLIEWAEKAKEYLPADAIWITFENIDDVSRKIKINNFN